MSIPLRAVFPDTKPNKHKESIELKFSCHHLCLSSLNYTSGVWLKRLR